MPLANKPLNEINEDDLQELIDNQVAEGKEYDYKLKLRANTNDEKKEFLADVSSFANTSGGHLIVGMDEKEGTPTAIVGLQGDMDAEKQRFENMLRDSVAPRIQGIGMQAVPVSGGNVLVIRIPQSWSAPHMVTLGRSSRFFGRNSAGKYPFDVYELRSAFTLSETARERIRNFRLDRIAKIVADVTPLRLSKVAKLVLHIVPMRDFMSTVDFSSLSIDKRIEWQHKFARPIVITNHRYNLDGLLFYGTSLGTRFRENYIQIFRNGAIEYVDTLLIDDIKKVIPSISYEKTLIELLPILCSVEAELEFQPPVIFMLSLLGVRDCAMGVSSYEAARHSGQIIDRDNLIFPYN